jgi:DNA-binding transcriptional MerR regulator
MMEYTINGLAKIAGVSTRTLRYYEELGLLSPARVSTNGYRIYGQKEIDLLQQILFYRELSVSLEDIRRIVISKDFDSETALNRHLKALQAKRSQLDVLIATLEKTLKAEKGELTMSDAEKFEGFKQKLLDDNDQQYGAEIRQKYGEDTVNESYGKIKGMTKEQYAEVEVLSLQVNETLKAAFEQGDPSGALAQNACELHKKWLCYFWPDYSKEAHMGVAQMYVDDPRFTAYYDKIAPGCAAFLRDAVMIYCK